MSPLSEATALPDVGRSFACCYLCRVMTQRPRFLNPDLPFHKYSNELAEPSTKNRTSELQEFHSLRPRVQPKNCVIFPIIQFGNGTELKRGKRWRATEAAFSSARGHRSQMFSQLIPFRFMNGKLAFFSRFDSSPTLIFDRNVQQS